MQPEAGNVWGGCPPLWPAAIVAGFSMLMYSRVAPMEPKHESDQKPDSLASASLPSPEGEPLDGKWIMRQLFSDPSVACLSFASCWAIVGIIFFLLPGEIREIIPGWAVTWWWSISGLLFIGFVIVAIWPDVMAWLSRPTSLTPEETARKWEEVNDRINALRYGPAPQGYRRGPKGGLFRVDSQGRKRYD